MPTHCSFRTGNRPRSLFRAAAASVLSALLPAGTMGMVDVRSDPSSQIFAAPSAQRGLPLPASALRVPAQLRIRTGEPTRQGDFDIGAIAQRGVADARSTGVSRQTQPVRPTVTILTPTDLAAVPAGVLRVRGTVSPHGDGVGVLVNGVRAVVRSGAFSAAVRVTPHTVILSAVAATSGGLTDCHQIGLAVSGSPADRLRLRPLPDQAAAALPQRFSLLPTAVLPFPQGDLDDVGAGDPSAGPPGRSRFTVEGLINRYLPATMNGAPAADGATATSLVLTRAHLEGRSSPAGPGLPEMGRRVSVEATRRALPSHARPEDRVESTAPNDPGSSVRDLTGTGSLSFRTRGEGDVEQNPRGKPAGGTYSFGLLFIFDADGLRQIRWY